MDRTKNLADIVDDSRRKQAMAEYIEREAVIDAVESTDWYHVSMQGNLVHGAISDGNALYKADDIFKVLADAPAADVAPVVHGLYIVSGDKLPPNPNGALTLSPEYIGKHESGWEIVADVHEDYYEWVNEFVAYKHDGWNSALVAGDFESVVVSSSKKDYEEFLSLFPPDAWDYGDI